MPVALSEAQLRVQSCVVCGGVGTTTSKIDSDERWWIGIRGERHGPYMLAQLAAYAAEGRISANSYVWGPSFETWARAGQVPQLSSAFAARSAPPPLPPALPQPTAAQAARTPARPVTRAGMFSGAGIVTEVSVSQPMPLPMQDSVIAPLSSVTGPAASRSFQKPATTEPRLDDVRRPPPTIFGMAAVTSSPAESSPTLPASVAKPAAPAPSVAAPVAAAPVPVVSVPAAVSAQPTPSAAAAPAASSDAASPKPALRASVRSAAIEPFFAPDPAVPTPAVKPLGTLPILPRAPEPAAASSAGGLDDDFFAPAGPRDIFAGVDSGAARASAAGIDLSAMMAESLPSGRVRHPTKAEMHSLREEFSVVARLEKQTRKRWLYVAAVAFFVVGVVIAIVLFAPARELEYGGKGTSVAGGSEVDRPLYDRPVVGEPPKDKVLLADEAPEAEAVVPTKDVRPTKTGSTGAARVAAKIVPPTEEEVKSTVLTAERFAELTRDEVGKSEVKLNFDTAEASRKAAEEAADKRATQSGDVAEKVADAFSKKKTQFARCSDATQERIKMIFTVTSTGKVVGAKVDGTQSETKRSCVLDILGRSLFPAGPEAMSYSQTLIL